MKRIPEKSLNCVSLLASALALCSLGLGLANNTGLAQGEINSPPGVFEGEICISHDETDGQVTNLFPVVVQIDSELSDVGFSLESVTTKKRYYFSANKVSGHLLPKGDYKYIVQEGLKLGDSPGDIDPKTWTFKAFTKQILSLHFRMSGAQPSNPLPDSRLPRNCVWAEKQSFTTSTSSLNEVTVFEMSNRSFGEDQLAKYPEGEPLVGLRFIEGFRAFQPTVAWIDPTKEILFRKSHIGEKFFIPKGKWELSTVPAAPWVGVRVNALVQSPDDVLKQSQRFELFQTSSLLNLVLCLEDSSTRCPIVVPVPVP